MLLHYDSAGRITIRSIRPVSQCFLTFRSRTRAAIVTQLTESAWDLQTALPKKQIYGHRPYGPVRVWSDYLVLTTMPKSCASLYSWASEPATSFRDAATLVSGDGMEAIVPVASKARGVLGSKAILRFEMII